MNKIKIAIDITYNPYGGAKTTIINMLSCLIELKNISIIIYSTKNNTNIIKEFEQDNVKIKISRLASISKIFRLIWQQLFLPFLLIINKVDVLFCPANIAPIFSPIKRVQWIGTIGPFFPEFYKHFNILTKIKLYKDKLFMISSANMANAVIFESQFTRKLFIKSYGIKLSRSHVINIGHDVYFRRVSSESKMELHNNYGKFIPYALCVSHLYPYKNIIRMLTSFKNAMENTDVKLKLLIVGSRDCKYYDEEILKTIEVLSLQQSVFLLGSVSKETLRYLYSNCELMIFPSPFENFARTLVEAMSCGAPIVSSNTTAMPETCQDAALYFNPYDIEDMTEKISMLISDEKLKLSLSQKSIARANELPDYEEVTIKTLNIIKNLVRPD